VNKKHKLNELASTAICGNDITSSVLYVSALAIAFAGQYAWITLLIVAGVLFLFRKIYAEVVGAIPLNGGAYNALLNTTSKFMASFAATLTILSYMATAVISGNEAMHYLHHLVPSLPIIAATVGLLSLFAILALSGIGESAKVAIGIFIFHLGSLLVLSGSIVLYLFRNGFGQLIENHQMPVASGSITTAIFLGFAASMLGVSGFESSANFVEEQKRGVFPKTLRNMWIIVSIINPLMAIFALSLFAVPTLQSGAYQNTLLVQMGKLAGGSWIAALVSIDAVLVLSGAVLTSYVGVTGLLERMTLDRILPNYFLEKNRRGSSYRIILMFLAMCISVLLITGGDVRLLAGVYTLSFLSVMALFGIGNILLKIKRGALPRPVKASWLSVFLAIAAVSVALLGNIVMEREGSTQSNVQVFLNYFIPFMAFIIIMLNRTLLLHLVLNAVEAIFQPMLQSVEKVNRSLTATINEINNQEFVFFTRGENIATLNKVMLYISNNEHTKQIKIVTVLRENEALPKMMDQEIDFLDREYPEISIEFVVRRGEFTPELIRELSNEWDIPINFMFIGSPSDKFPYRVEELGGVRLII
jgi:amino acid transporter